MRAGRHAGRGRGRWASQPFRVEKLVGQARRWTVGELEDALEGLLELDAHGEGRARTRLDGAAAAAGVRLWIGSASAATRVAAR